MTAIICSSSNYYYEPTTCFLRIQVQFSLNVKYERFYFFIEKFHELNRGSRISSFKFSILEFISGLAAGEIG